MVRAEPGELGYTGDSNHFKRGEDHESIELSSLIELGDDGAIAGTTFAYAKAGDGGDDELASCSRTK